MTPTLPKNLRLSQDWFRFKAITLPHHAEETPTRWLSSLCTVNKYNAKRDYWTARTASFLIFFFCLFDCIVFCHMQREIGRGRRGVGCLMGKGSQTKLKTEQKKWIILKWFPLDVFGLSNAVKQQYILNLTNVWLYFMGEREYGNSCFLQRLTEPETEGFSFSSSIIIADSHPLWTLTARFRDDVVMFYCEGTAHTSMENKHYSCFLSFFRSVSNTSYHCAHPWMCLMLVLVLSHLSLQSLKQNGEATSANGW